MNLKRRGQLGFTGLLIVVITLTMLPVIFYKTLYQVGQELHLPFFQMDEEDIFNLQKEKKASELLQEIIELEKTLPGVEEKMALSPYLLALIEKEAEFTENQLIERMRDEETDSGLESALLRMLMNKNEKAADFIPLLNDDGIRQETKESIVALGNFSKAELGEIFSSYNDGIAIMAMKRIAPLDAGMALELASPLLLSPHQDISDEKTIAAFLGVARYFEYHSRDGEDEEFDIALKDKIGAAIKEIYKTSSNNHLKDQAIYAMARMKDYDLFAYIIDSEDVDLELKVSATESNVDLMIERISTARTYDDIRVILYAMKLYPIIEVGTALESSLAYHQLETNKEVTELIEFIKNNGVKRDEKNKEE